MCKQVPKPTPCAFCGSDNIRASGCKRGCWSGINYPSSEYVVTCYHCGAKGPKSNQSLDEAVRMWNDRRIIK